MKERSEGAGRRREPTPSEAKRPDQKPTLREAGEGTRGVSKPQQESGEHQASPSVWDFLETRVRIFEEDSSDAVKARKIREWYRLKEERHNKGKPRDKLILRLDTRPPHLTLLSPREEFQQFRLQFEHLSDEELREEDRRQEEEDKARLKALSMGATFGSGVGLGEVITKQKRK